MLSIKFRHKYNLPRRKITLLLILVLGLNTLVIGQKEYEGINLPKYDLKEIHYGFLMGLHTSTYRSYYSRYFIEPSLIVGDFPTDEQYELKEALDTLGSVEPMYQMGFDLGFVFNLRLHEFFDFRVLPTVGFHEYKTRYFFNTGYEEDQLIESTTIDLPMLIKYKSARRGNSRMYFIGGIKPSFEASSLKNKDDGEDRLSVRAAGLSIDYGFGIDLYYPLFKFSPELRFSHGVTNMLKKGVHNRYTLPLEGIYTHTVSLFFLFE